MGSSDNKSSWWRYIGYFNNETLYQNRKYFKVNIDENVYMLHQDIS